MNINDIVKSATKTNSKKSEPAVPMPPLQRYLRRPGRLTDAGNAYLVLPVGLLDQLPVGLLDQLPVDQQEQLVAIATTLGHRAPHLAQRDDLPGASVGQVPPRGPERGRPGLARHHP